MKVTSEIIQVPIYNQDFCIFYGNATEYLDYIRVEFGYRDLVTGRTQARTLELKTLGKRHLVLFLNSEHITEIDPKCFSIISHELIHLTGSVMDFAGIKHDINNDEAWAYLSGFLSHKIFDFLKIRL